MALISSWMTWTIACLYLNEVSSRTKAMLICQRRHENPFHRTYSAARRLHYWSGVIMVIVNSPSSTNCWMLLHHYMVVTIKNVIKLPKKVYGKELRRIFLTVLNKSIKNFNSGKRRHFELYNLVRFMIKLKVKVEGGRIYWWQNFGYFKNW